MTQQANIDVHTVRSRIARSPRNAILVVWAFSEDSENQNQADNQGMLFWWSGHLVKIVNIKIKQITISDVEYMKMMAATLVAI